MTAALIRASRALDRLTALALVPLVALFTGILITAVFKRYVLGTSFIHAVELTRVAFMWATFLAAASGVHRMSHIRVTVLADALPASARRGLEAAVQLATLGFALLLVWHGIAVTARMAATVLPTLAWPQSVLYAAVPTGGAVAALHALANIAATLTAEQES
ncbi:TRAP transporter small permease [Elioraea sp.]|uniref:TRAP transporter small permease n=1 Tax=Elioraea sp. TaxID=2185103 RepID=UPI003F70E320